MTKRQRDFNKRIQKTITFLENHGWCTGAFAKDVKGNHVPPLSKEATNFCMLGAYRAANKVNQHTDIFERHEYLFGMIPATYNDQVATKKERVIGRLRKMLYT